MRAIVDRTLALLFGGYRFIPERRRKRGSNVFETRVLGQRVICMSGPDTARLLYDEDRFERATALPKRVKETLSGKEGVQGLDDATHKHRKAMFMSLMTSPSIRLLTDQSAKCWEAGLDRWRRADQIVLFDEAREVLFRAACSWAQVQLEEAKISSTASDMALMVDGFATVGPRHWRARRARKSAESAIGSIVRRVRDGDSHVEEGSVAYVVAHHRDLGGNLLDERVAAVELLNLLRPIVAIAWYVTFAAHALHLHPEWKSMLREGGDQELELFVQAIRRFYPFTPFVAARARTDFEWRGKHFPRGRLVLLDVYGTHHDPAQWDHPEAFAPDRFRQREVGAFDFIPQGGGDPFVGHRCAGEQITIDLIKVAVSFLTRRMEYEVPDQDLRISLRSIPTVPKSRFVISHIRSVAASSSEGV